MIKPTIKVIDYETTDYIEVMSQDGKVLYSEDIAKAYEKMITALIRAYFVIDDDGGHDWEKEAKKMIENALKDAGVTFDESNNN